MMALAEVVWMLSGCKLLIAQVITARQPPLFIICLK